MEKKSRKTLIAIITIIVLICALVVSYFTIFANNKTVKIASTRTVIEYFDSTGLTAYYNDKMGVTISWIEYDDGDTFEQIKGEVGKSADSMPDAYLGLNISDAQLQIIGPEMLLDMTTYIDGNTETFREIIKSEDIAAQVRSGSGIYSFPSLYDDYAGRYPQKVWINKAWLEAVGAEMPATPEQLYDVLVKFKNNDPNGNGQADEVALACAYEGAPYSGFGFIINAYAQTPYDLSSNQPYMSVDADGNIYTAVTSNGFKEALRYINRLVAEGLVSANVFGNGKDYLAATMDGESYGVIACPDILSVLGSIDRAKGYLPMAPLSGDVVATAVRKSNVTVGGFMIANDSRHVVALMKMGDMMLSQEGTLSMLYGKKGFGWEDADAEGAMGGTMATWKIIYNSDSGRVVVSASKVPIWYSADVLVCQQAVADAEGNIDLQTEENWQGYLNKITRDMYEAIGADSAKTILPEFTLSRSQEEALGNIRGDVYGYISSTCKDFVLGNRGIDDSWDDYINTLNEKGIGRIIEAMQNSYNAQ